jgi:hypothetical protein
VNDATSPFARLRSHYFAEADPGHFLFERGQLESSIRSVRALVGSHFPKVEIEMRQPMPLARMLLHYQYGWPRLATVRPFGALMGACDRAFEAIWPRRWWAYIVARSSPTPDAEHR